MIDFKKRIIAIQLNKAERLENVKALLQDFNKFNIDAQFIAFCPFNLDLSKYEDELKSIGNTEIVKIPEDKNNISKRKNYVLNYMQENNYSGFLHILEDIIQLQKDPLEFINQIENVINVLDYDIWFSTETDICNYIFNKFAPRLTIDINDEDTRKKLNMPEQIYFTSNSNIDWLVYKINPGTEILKFNESFDVSMYMIIDYLSRRRATKAENQLYYMNQYLSIPEERGVFKSFDKNLNEMTEELSKKIAEENQIFQSLNVNVYPDNSVDCIMNAFYSKLSEKMV